VTAESDTTQRPSVADPRRSAASAEPLFTTEAYHRATSNRYHAESALFDLIIRSGTRLANVAPRADRFAALKPKSRLKGAVPYPVDSCPPN
jgi:hypothetical protein